MMMITSPGGPAARAGGGHIRVRVPGPDPRADSDRDWFSLFVTPEGDYYGPHPRLRPGRPAARPRPAGEIIMLKPVTVWSLKVGDHPPMYLAGS
jgi:hypothetical protein